MHAHTYTDYQVQLYLKPVTMPTVNTTTLYQAVSLSFFNLVISQKWIDLKMKKISKFQKFQVLIGRPMYYAEILTITQFFPM
jgi:hypothetical protein